MAKVTETVTGVLQVTTTREQPDPHESQPDADQTQLDPPADVLWDYRTQARPGESIRSNPAVTTATSIQPDSPPRDAVPEPVLPESIGPFDIERRLGAGGMGTVYLGRERGTGQIAAVKVLSASLAREPEIIERFNREIEAMQKLSGPHVVSLFGSGTDPETDQMYFSMEYVEGVTLGQLLSERKRLSWDQVVDISLQICSALKAAHAAGIVHRDLKPSNLLIGSDGVVQLTDFGVAQVFATQRLTVTGGIIGTAEYMSPEQAEGRRCTKKSDLYSFGAVMYVMLTGRPPFTGQTSLDILRKHLTARFDRPSRYAPETPRLLEDLVCKLLEKDPDDRHPDAHIVSLRLREVVRRVELASAHETESRGVLDGDGPVAATAAARPVIDATVVDAHRDPAAGPGPATLMRNVFRAEISNSQRKSPIGEFFDQTWVLVVCLALVILGGVVWFQVMGSSTVTTPTTTYRDEVDRFIRLAASYRRLGDVAREEQILRALGTVIQHDESRAEELKQIDDRLTNLTDRRRRDSQDYRLGSDGLARADELLQSGEAEAALELLTGLLVLYESEPGAQHIISRIESRLRETRLTRDDIEAPASPHANVNDDVESDETQEPERDSNANRTSDCR
jgi:serine/threonine-protein kinase